MSTRLSACIKRMYLSRLDSNAIRLLIKETGVLSKELCTLVNMISQNFSWDEAQMARTSVLVTAGAL